MREAVDVLIGGARHGHGVYSGWRGVVTGVVAVVPGQGTQAMAAESGSAIVGRAMHGGGAVGGKWLVVAHHRATPIRARMGMASSARRASRAGFPLLRPYLEDGTQETERERW